MSGTRITRPSIAEAVVLRSLIVALTLGTASIHLTLGGLRFTLSASGYVVGAIAMVLPLALAIRHRWIIRLGLAGYAAGTIVAWALEGPFYPTAYLTKGIELALIGLLAIEFTTYDGQAVERIRRQLRAFLA
jgi:hypothetical protein